MKKIAFIFPSPIVGGHELMAIRIIKKWSDKNVTVDAYAPSENKRLLSILKSKSISSIEYDFSHKRLQIFHAFLNPFYRFTAFKFLKSISGKYDDIIIVQGDIELGCVFLLMAKKCGIKVISYLPYTHSFKKMGAYFGITKDFLSGFVYRSCNKYITISECFRRELYCINPSSVVELVENFLDDVPARVAKIGLNTPAKIFIIGRIYFKQKNHDVFLRAFFEFKKITNLDVELHVVGDGPDKKKLEKLAEKYNIATSVIFHGWLSDCWALSQEIDLLVIPSKFEGVPLTMIEAHNRGIPILASAVDGMKDYLPPESCYTVDNNEVDALVNALSEFFSKKP